MKAADLKIDRRLWSKVIKPEEKKQEKETPKPKSCENIALRGGVLKPKRIGRIQKDENDAPSFELRNKNSKAYRVRF